MSAAPAASASKNAVRLYRQLLGQARRLPEDKRAEALKQIREGFRDNRGVDDASRVEKLLESARSSLGYLRMVTPRRPDRGEGGSGGEGGRYRIVYKDGQSIEGGENESSVGRKAVSNWNGSNLDPDSVTRHRSQLSRMGFRDNAHAKGFF